MDLKDPHFKSCFWEWFDSLPKQDKKRFQYYSADMAELYFYNKVYSRTSYSDNTSAFQADARGLIPLVRSSPQGM